MKTVEIPLHQFDVARRKPAYIGCSIDLTQQLCDLLDPPFLEFGTNSIVLLIMLHEVAECPMLLGILHKSVAEHVQVTN